MSKIIHFKSNKILVDEYIQSLNKYIVENGIDNIMIACKNKKTKEICTGYFNLDAGDKQELVGHIQVDIIDNMIQRNIDRYIELT